MQPLWLGGSEVLGVGCPGLCNHPRNIQLYIQRCYISGFIGSVLHLFPLLHKIKIRRHAIFVEFINSLPYSLEVKEEFSPSPTAPILCYINFNKLFSNSGGKSRRQALKNMNI